MNECLNERKSKTVSVLALDSRAGLFWIDILEPLSSSGSRRGRPVPKGGEDKVTRRSRRGKRQGRRRRGRRRRRGTRKGRKMKRTRHIRVDETIPVRKRRKMSV